MQGTGENILATGIGAEQMDKTIIDTKEMGAAGNETEQFIFGSFDKKLDIAPLIFVHCFNPAEVCLDRPFTFNHMQERPYRTAVLVTEQRDIRRTVQIVFVAAGNCRIIGRQERRKNP